MTAVRKSETCEEQLKRMVRNVADEITSGKTERLSKYKSKCEVILEPGCFMEGVYDIRYLVDREKRFLGAELLVAGGGPTVWVDTFWEQVTGWWGTDRVEWYYQDNIGLNDYLENLYACS